MIKNFKRNITAVVLSALVFTTASIGSLAASYSYPGTVKGDGVRIRQYPDYGSILELMYNGERVSVDKEMTDASGSGSYYLKRNSTGCVGYTVFIVK